MSSQLDIVRKDGTIYYKGKRAVLITASLLTALENKIIDIMGPEGARSFFRVVCRDAVTAAMGEKAVGEEGMSRFLEMLKEMGWFKGFSLELNLKDGSARIKLYEPYKELSQHAGETGCLLIESMLLGIMERALVSSDEEIPKLELVPEKCIIKGAPHCEVLIRKLPI